MREFCTQANSPGAAEGDSSFTGAGFVLSGVCTRRVEAAAAGTSSSAHRSAAAAIPRRLMPPPRAHRRPALAAAAASIRSSPGRAAPPADRPGRAGGAGWRRRSRRAECRRRSAPRRPRTGRSSMPPARRRAHRRSRPALRGTVTAVISSPCSSATVERFIGARLAVQLGERETLPQVRRHDGVQRQQGGRQVGRRHRDAVARLQAVLAVVADLGVAGVAAAQPALQVGVAEVPAAHRLAQVPGHGAHLAQLRRGDWPRPPGRARRSGRRRPRRGRRRRSGSRRRSRCRPRRARRPAGTAARTSTTSWPGGCRAAAAARDRCRRPSPARPARPAACAASSTDAGRE